MPAESAVDPSGVADGGRDAEGGRSPAWSRDDVHSLTVADGSVVEYSDDGDGPTVVLIHAGGFADWFVATAASLRQQGFRVVRMRRAGYGDTAPPSGLTLADHASHTASVLDHLGITHTHVVGHSSGALVAFDLAAARPDLVASLILFEPAPGGPFAPRPASTSAPTAGQASDPFDAFMTMACGPDHLAVLTKALGPAGLDRARAEGAYFLADEMPAVVNWPFLPATAARLAQPVTLACGDASLPAYRQVCEQMRDLLPRANIISVAGADHLYTLRQPTEFAQLIADCTSSPPD